MNGEVKGARLDESHVAGILDLLGRDDALVEVFAIDAGMHTAHDITEFRHLQSEFIGRHATGNPDPRVRQIAARLRDNVEAMSDQLFVQAWGSMLLVERVVQTASLYYALRGPRELARFRWTVDAEGTTLTDAEDFWTSFVPPFAETRSQTRPLRLLENGDYSHFKRFISRMPGAAQITEPGLPAVRRFKARGSDWRSRCAVVRSHHPGLVTLYRRTRA